MEASTELSQQQDLLSKVKKEGAHQFRKILVPLTMVLLVFMMIMIYPKALFIWFIVSLFLYSYNFLFLMLPTTSKDSRPKKSGFAGRPNSNNKWLALKILLRKRKLAVEMGLTLFLGRMVPLTMSFTIILGMGMSILVYFMLTAYTAASGLTWLIIFQVSLILLFYVLVNILNPQAQGISAIARSWRRRLGIARFRGRAATISVKLAMLGVVATSSTLFIGGMILPGVTLVTILSSMDVFNFFDLMLAIGLFVVQMWVMRSFQSLMSRRMAKKLLYVRIDKLEELLTIAENIRSSGDVELERTQEFQNVLSEYYSMMIYDIFRLDFFGRAPVYLVGPRFKYVLDEKALLHIP
ncbi:MAG: hypothetical protein MIO90_06695 [Methanomassiliicoccales archaeon]|nr:hypothetical protein [Methanomassiliicoccales archaeon]